MSYSSSSSYGSNGADGEIKSADGEINAADGEVKSANGEINGADGEIKSADGEINGGIKTRKPESHEHWT